MQITCLCVDQSVLLAFDISRLSVDVTGKRPRHQLLLELADHLGPLGGVFRPA